MWLVRTIVRWKKSIRKKFKNAFWKMQYGDRCEIEKIEFRDNFRIVIVRNGKLKIGKGCFFNNDCSINVLDKVSIGENCIFGENVKIYDHNHKYKDCTRLIKEQDFVTDEIVIEEDCWIASNVTILKGVRIGRHSVVGAGVVVYKDLPANSVTVCKQNIITDVIGNR